MPICCCPCCFLCAVALVLAPPPGLIPAGGTRWFVVAFAFPFSLSGIGIRSNSNSNSKPKAAAHSSALGAVSSQMQVSSQSLISAFCTASVAVFGPLPLPFVTGELLL
jgi:hypothetical protein